MRVTDTCSLEPVSDISFYFPLRNDEPESPWSSLPQHPWFDRSVSLLKSCDGGRTSGWGRGVAVDLPTAKRTMRTRSIIMYTRSTLILQDDRVFGVRSTHACGADRAELAYESKPITTRTGFKECPRGLLTKGPYHNLRTTR